MGLHLFVKSTVCKNLMPVRVREMVRTKM